MTLQHLPEECINRKVLQAVAKAIRILESVPETTVEYVSQSIILDQKQM